MGARTGAGGRGSGGRRARARLLLLLAGLGVAAGVLASARPAAATVSYSCSYDSTHHSLLVTVTGGTTASSPLVVGATAVTISGQAATALTIDGSVVHEASSGSSVCTGPTVSTDATVTLTTTSPSSSVVADLTGGVALEFGAKRQAIAIDDASGAFASSSPARCLTATSSSSATALFSVDTKGEQGSALVVEADGSGPPGAALSGLHDAVDSVAVGSAGASLASACAAVDVSFAPSPSSSPPAVDVVAGAFGGLFEDATSTLTGPPLGATVTFLGAGVASASASSLASYRFVPATFGPGTTVVLGARGPGGAASPTSVLDLSASAASATVGVGTESSSATSPGVVVVGSTGATAAYVHFGGVQQVVGTRGPTVFAAGSSGGVSFVGKDPARTLLELPGLSGLGVAMSGTAADSGTVTGLAPPSGQDAFSGVATVVGSPRGATTFGESPLFGMRLEGLGAGNSLVLPSAATSAGYVVTMGSTAGSGTAGASGSSSVDVFSGMQQILGSSAGRTTFREGPAFGTTFVGRGSGNVLDLVGTTSPLVVDVGGDATSSLGSVAASGSAVADHFAGISSFVEEPPSGTGSSGGVEFDAASATGVAVSFAGLGGPHDRLVVPDVANVAVCMSGSFSGDALVPTTTTSGAGTCSASGALTDVFSGVTGIVGAAAGSTQFYPTLPAVAAGPEFAGLGLGDVLHLPASTVPLEAAVNGNSASSPGTLASGSGTDTFTGIQTLAASSTDTGGVGFEAGVGLVAGPSGAPAGMTFLGSGSSADRLVLPSSSQTTTLTVTSPATATEAAGTIGFTSSGGVGLVDHFSGIESFSSSPGASATTTFDAGVFPGLAFSGEGSSAPSVLALGGATATDVVTPGTSLRATGTVVAAATGAGCGATGTVLDRFSGIVALRGNPGLSAAQPGATVFCEQPPEGLDYEGVGPSNSLVLPSLQGLVVAGGAYRSGSVAVTSGGATDVFSGIETVVGSSAGSTTFAAGPGGGIDFVGGGSRNLLVTPAIASTSATVTVNGDSTASPGTLVASTGAPDEFSDVASFAAGAPSAGVVYVPSPTLGGLRFAGLAAAADQIDLPLGSPLAAISSTVDVSVNGDSASSPGDLHWQYTVLSGPSFEATDTFTGLETFDESAAEPAGARFAAGADGGERFIGAGSSGDLLVLPSSSATLVVDMSGAGAGSVSGLEAATTGGPQSDSFSGVGTIDGNAGAGGTTFEEAAAGGETFVGEGSASANALDLAAETGLTVALGAPGEGEVTGLSAPDAFSDIGTVAASASGTTFLEATVGGTTLVGAGTGNVLELPSVPSSLTVAVNGDSRTNLGEVEGLDPAPGTSVLTTDYFADLQRFVESTAATAGSVAFETSATVGGLSFTGAGRPGDEIVLPDDVGVSACVTGFSSGTVEFPGNACGTSSPVPAPDTFSQVPTLSGSAGGVTFDVGAPGALAGADEGGMSFFGAPGTPNTLELPPVSGLEVAVGQDSASSPGTLSGLPADPGGVTTDRFGSVTVFVEQGSGGASFEAPTFGGLVFEGAGVASDTLALPAAATTLDVAVNGDTTSSPGVLSGLVAGPASSSGSTTADEFSGIAVLDGNSGSGGTQFALSEASTTLRELNGEGSGTNALSLASFSGSADTVTVDAATTDTVAIASGATTVASYGFSGIKDFTGCVSPSNCAGTVFLAGSGSGYAFDGLGAATGSQNTLSFAEEGSGVVVSVAGGGGTAALATGDDTFSGIGIFIGSPGADTFDVGNGNYVLDGGGGTDTLDLSGFSSGATVTLSPGPSSGPYAGLEEASVSVAGYEDEAYGFTVLEGSSAGGNTFVSDGYGGHEFIAGGSDNTVDLGLAAGPVTVDAAGTCSVLPDCVTGLSPSLLPGSSSTVDYLSGFTTFLGAASHPTTFEAANAAGLTFVGRGSGPNVLDLTKAAAGVTVNAAVTPETITIPNANPPQDFASDIQSVLGPTNGDATFDAGSASDYPAGTACSSSPAYTSFVGNGSGNTVSLSALSTSATAVLTVTGTPPGTSSVASACQRGDLLDSFVDAAQLVGASSGETTFVLPSTGGITVAGEGTGNTLSFADISPGAAGVTIEMASDVAFPGTGQDDFSDITSFVGSPNDDQFVAGPGDASFIGGGGSDTLTFAGAQNGVHLVMANGVATATGGYGGTITASGVTTYVLSDAGGNTVTSDGVGGFSFVGASATQATNDLSFADAPASQPLVFSLSSGGGTVSGLVAPAGGGATDNFSGFAQLSGSPATDAFDQTSGDFTLVGGGGNDTLSFAGASVAVNVDLATSPHQATGNGIDDTFSGIRNFVGAPTGGNAFEAAAAGGDSFEGLGAAGNVLSLATVPVPTSGPGLGVTVGGDSPSSPGTVTGLSAGAGGATTDAFSGMQGVIGPNEASAAAPTTFSASCVTGITFTGGGSANVLSFSDCTTAGETLVVEQASGVAALATGEDDFSGITTFVGLPGGATDFEAAGTGVDTSFVGTGSGNELDLSAAPAGATVDVSGDDLAAPGQAELAPGLTDSFAGISSFVGSAQGATTFVAGGTPLVGSCSASALTFSGKGTGNVLDLGALPAGTRVAVAAGTACVGSVGYVSFAGISTFYGSDAGSTTFVASGTTPATFVGRVPSSAPAGEPAPNALDLSATPAGTVVDANADTVTVPAGTGSFTDDFSGIGAFVGSAQGATTFRASATTSDDFVGEGSLANTLDLSDLPSGVMLDVASGEVQPEAGVTITFSGVRDFLGSLDGGTTFEAPASGGDRFVGQGGSGNTLSFADSGIAPGAPGVTVNLAASSPSATLPGQALPDNFSGMQTIVGSLGDDVFIPGASDVSLVGGGGVDTLDEASAPAAVEVNLSSEPYVTSSGLQLLPGEAVGGAGGTVSLSGIQNVVSSNFGDTIVGNALPSTFVGGAGTDTFVLTGGATVIRPGTGRNVIDLSLTTSFVTLNLAQATPQETGGAGLLTLVPGSVEEVIGSPAGDAIEAGPGSVTLVGGSGTNWLEAGSGEDTLDAGLGQSVLVGGSGEVTMNGGPGATDFVPGSGTTFVNDPDHTGTLDFSAAPAGVDVNLSSSPYTTPTGLVLPPELATGGYGGRVYLSGVENVIGTNHGDVIVGTPGPNHITDGNGNNFIVGLGGGDTLVGGDGSNTFVTGPGDNIVIGGTGGDNTIDYSTAPAAVDVNLLEGTASNGWGGTDSLTNIENIIGSPNAGDVLVAGAVGGTIQAGNGANVEITGSPAGHDHLIGGNGGDTFTSLGPDDVMVGGSGDDYFFADNGYLDYINGGGGVNTAYVDCADVAASSYTNIQFVYLPAGGCGGTSGSGGTSVASLAAAHDPSAPGASAARRLTPTPSPASAPGTGAGAPLLDPRLGLPVLGAASPTPAPSGRGRPEAAVDAPPGVLVALVRSLSASLSGTGTGPPLASGAAVVLAGGIVVGLERRRRRRRGGAR